MRSIAVSFFFYLLFQLISEFCVFQGGMGMRGPVPGMGVQASATPPGFNDPRADPRRGGRGRGDPTQMQYNQYSGMYPFSKILWLCV